jgi:hypothetical protein
MTTTTPHTPGPWKFNDNGIYVGNAHWIAKAKTYETTREQTANFRLIAAGPQMLEALRAALEAMGDTYDARDAAGTEGEQLRDQIAEAIAAATGEPADY